MRLTIIVILAILLPLANVPSALAEPPPPKSPLEQMESLEKSMESLQKSITNLQKSIDALGEKMKDANLSTNATIAELKTSLAELKRQLSKQGDQMKTIRKSFSVPPNSTGTLRLVNRSQVQATYFINGVPYDVLPGETRNLTNQTAGSFTYSVTAMGFGSIQPEVTRTLRADRTFTIYVNP